MSANGYHFEQESYTFTLLASGKPRWRSFGAGFGIEFLVLACALWIPALFPQQMAEARQYMVTRISMPVLQPYKPQPKVQPKLEKHVEVVKEMPKPDPVVIPDPPKPKIIEPVFAKLNVVRPVVRNNPTPAPKVNEWARMVPDKPTVSLGSSAMPDLKKPRAPVQTGGFGDPQGLPATTSKITRPVNINAAGGFDMPEGPGKGNGTGGAKGVQGVVASAGFGNGTAIAGGERNTGHVQSGLFADDAATAGPSVRKTSNEIPQTQPVVILYKPEPQYTAEGKQAKIQGEVVLQVVFRASGQVQVLRVLQGLGHGLDENAEVAARQIKFTPAKQDGQPVDFPANVRIDFELAY
ncbi:MAG: energy transducer TonB [Candidatus Acidiferrales bacterium]